MARDELTLDILITGFGEAYYRLLDRAEGPKPGKGPAQIPLFEALHWAVTIDDRLRRDRNDGDWWKQVDGGEVLRGFRHARNRVHHQWAAAMGQPLTKVQRRNLENPRWYPFPERIPTSPYAKATWRWIRSLPPGRPDRVGEELYAKHLGGHLVRETMEQLHAMFLTLTED